VTGDWERLDPDYTYRGPSGSPFPIMFSMGRACSALRLNFREKSRKKCPRRTRRVTEARRIAAYCRSRISSTATLPPLSTLTTLWIGLKPVSVTSTM
jgi:hypothetical protein